MRAVLVLAAVVLTASAGSAAPGPWARPGSTPEHPGLRSEARRFAQQLIVLVDQVSALYVRPVTRGELLQAALAGLYEAARRPVPRDLRARLERALAPVASPGPDGIPEPPPPGGDPLLRLVRQLREEVGDAEALRGQEPLLVCCRALVRALDPHSGVVSAEEQRRTPGLEYEHDGFGVELNDLFGTAPPRVEVVLLGGPAQRAGLRPGDTITHLDRRPIGSAPPALVLALGRRGGGEVLQPGGNACPSLAEDVHVLRVRYRRPGAKGTRTALLQRERFHPESVLGVARCDDNSWDYLADPHRHIAHVRLATLGRGTAEELREVLEGLQGRDCLRGLVLDLRWCPGGYLNEAVEVADLFLGKGTVATVRSRDREPTVYRASDVCGLRGFPVVVLVNGETSGGAELIAAALQDHKRAVVVGQRTLGKASVQTPLAVGLPGVSLKITSGTFVRPSGKNLHRFPDSKPGDDWGVCPDEGGEFRISADLARQLKQWWLLQSLRPGPSRERLEMDDPTADPQRQAALAVVGGLLRRTVRAKGE
jgi:C-terminal processing protease CtpA/Prc